MIHSIIDNIKTELTSLEWVDKLGDVVIPLKINVNNGPTAKGKTIPVCYNNDITTCNTSKYIDYCPNSKYKSVSYFEVENIKQVSVKKKYSIYETTLRYVCWLNIPKINNVITKQQIIKEVLNTIPHNISQQTPFVFALLTLNTIKEGSDIFNKYSYDEADKQFMIYPYYAFALEYDLIFRDVSSCNNIITLNPNQCI